VILVVDDDAEICEALSTILSAAGHDVAACGSAQEALERAAVDEPELIISDVMMPGQGGFELRAEYAARHPERRTPFVFLSSLGQPDDVVRGLDSGVEDYLVKPVHEKVLRAKVRSILDSRRRWASPAFRGDLARFPFIKVLRFCEMQGLTGQVEFEAGSFRAAVSFRAGSLVADDNDAGADDRLGRLYDLTEGTFTIRSQGVEFRELAGVAAPTGGPTAAASAPRPAGRLSTVDVGGRAVHVQTEVVGPPGRKLVTAATLDGRTLFKRISEPPEDAEAGFVEGVLEVQHAAVERDVREAQEKLLIESVERPDWKERFDRLFEEGFVEYRKGRWEAARAVWEEARALNPSDKVLEVNLRVVLGKLGHRDVG
jgi:DNA-binding response OmpR family regulator